VTATDEQARLDAMLAEVEEFDDLDAAYAEVARKPYGFTWEGRRWVLPHIGELDYRVQDEIENASELSLKQIHELFGRIFGPIQGAEWERTTQPGTMLKIFFERWVSHSGRKQGEEQASEPSSESTGANSKPTSAASTDSDSPKRSTAKRAPRKAASRRGNSST
jgi:hypothetical protein